MNAADTRRLALFRRYMRLLTATVRHHIFLMTDGTWERYSYLRRREIVDSWADKYETLRGKAVNLFVHYYLPAFGRPLLLKNSFAQTMKQEMDSKMYQKMDPGLWERNAYLF